MKLEYSNEEIIVGIRDGSESIFSYLYTKYYRSLNRFSFNIVMCDNSHDIVQEIFANLWISRETLHEGINLKSYLYAAVKNSSLNYLKHLGVRDNKRSKIIESILLVNDNTDEDEELLSIVNNLIEDLPNQQKNVIKLKFEGLSYKQIATEMNISTKTVNGHVIKAYDYIRNKLVIFIFMLIIFLRLI